MANSPISHDSLSFAVEILPTDSPISMPIENGTNCLPLDGPNSPTRPIKTTVRPKGKGRPKGSKNRPKPIPLAQHIATNAHVLDIQPGCDVVEKLHYFARTQNTGVTVDNGVGRVRNVSVRNTANDDDNLTVSYPGVHEILSIQWNHVGPAMQVGQDGGGPKKTNVVVQLAESSGIVWGGHVLGKMVAVSNVLLKVTTFENYKYHMLTETKHDPTHLNLGIGGSSEGELDQSGPGPLSSLDNELTLEPTASMKGRKRSRAKTRAN